MRAAGLLASALAMAGCYRPGAENNCSIRCSASLACDNGFVCEGNLCRDPMQQACGSDLPNDGGPDPDAYLDAPMLPDAPFYDAAMNCWGRDLYTYCNPMAPVGDGMFPAGSSINTDGSVCLADADPRLCVQVYARVTVTGPLFVTGSRPLVLIAADTFTINAAGEIDVSSSGGKVGAGAGVGTCTTGTPGVAMDDAFTSGGGAGGTLSGRGGFGGTSGPIGGGAGGTPGMPANATVMEWRGGCSGTSGGGIGAGAGGLGGGAVILIAGGTMHIVGKVLARGAGGSGGGPGRGGGGGGSGGLIALDAESIVLAGSLVAAGGGGGGGGGLNDPGLTGGLASGTGDVAPGGAGGTSGGGHGGPGSGPAVDRDGGPGGGVMSAGAGGGGGAAGLIRIYGAYTPQGTPSIVPPRT